MRFFFLVLFSLYCASNADIKISSFNVNYGNTKYHETIQLIKSNSPDIILIQESTPSFKKFADKLFGSEYKHTWYVQGKLYVAGGFAIVSKFPMSDKKFIPKTKGLFGFQTAKVKINGNQINLINVHLNPARLPKSLNLQTAIHTMMMNSKVQAVEIKKVIASINKKEATIVAGDFNSLPMLVSYKKLKAFGFKDAGENFGAEPTWKWKLSGRPFEARIDYIFHNDFFETKGFKVVKSDLSDHYLLNCKLKLHKKI